MSIKDLINSLKSKRKTNYDTVLRAEHYYEVIIFQCNKLNFHEATIKYSLLNHANTDLGT